MDCEMTAENSDWPGRWNHVRKFLERGGPFTHPDFEPSSETLDFLQETCKILVIGAGGLGCELLKDLALLGFRNVHVIDMDTIELSNLNRQFLFRVTDVNKPKAIVAAEFINSRIPGCRVVPHYNKIQDFDEAFYRQGTPIDGDDPQHLQWVYEKALERAKEFNISGVTYRLTQGVIKHIIPAVASTNAVIAAACATEVFKLATSCCNPLSNYMVFNDVDGIYTYTFEAEKKVDCLACSQKPQTLNFTDSVKLQDVIDYLINSAAYQMKSPGLTTTVDGKNRTLYMPTVASIEEKTKPNLKKTLKELGIQNGQELVVADVTTPNSIIFQLNLTPLPTP